MPAAVSLKDIVDALSMADDEIESFVDPQTGEVVTISEDERMLVERDDDDANADDDAEQDEWMPDWQREDLPRIREIVQAVETERLLALPNKFEIDEWRMMARFAAAQANTDHARQLEEAIHGRGAFRMFRSTLDRLGLREAWHRFHDAALEEIARTWAEEHGLTLK